VTAPVSPTRSTAMFIRETSHELSPRGTIVNRHTLISTLLLCLASVLIGCGTGAASIRATSSPVPLPTITPAPPASTQAQAQTRDPSQTAVPTETATSGLTTSTLDTDPSPTPASLVEATSTPTVTPTSSPPRAEVTTDGLDVRTGPGTAYPSIGQLEAGTEVEILGPDADGTWWQVSSAAHEEGPGWVPAEHVDTPIEMLERPVVEVSPAPPTVTPTPLHLLMIEVMRQQAYPGSDIVIEERLDPGANYDRYIVSYRSEGLKIYALLTVPQGQKPERGWPAIVFNHGHIPPDQYRTTERYVAYVDAFARNGYIVFRSDYRGHGNSEGEPSSSYGAPDYTVDVLNAVASVKRYSDADPDRIGMWGHSMGGGITLRAMVVTGDIKAGVIWAGSVAPYRDVMERQARRYADRATPTVSPTGGRRRWTQELLEYGSFEENPAFWASIDPTSYLAELSGPLQLHHGTADSSVPVEYSEKLYTMLQEVGHPVELYVYEGDNHNISASLGIAMQKSIQFFDTHLAPQP
jgi:fermentation-respiration switch protein FrsA (DUF1100 family)